MNDGLIDILWTTDKYGNLDIDYERMEREFTEQYPIPKIPI